MDAWPEPRPRLVNGAACARSGLRQLSRAIRRPRLIAASFAENIAPILRKPVKIITSVQPRNWGFSPVGPIACICAPPPP